MLIQGKATMPRPVQLEISESALFLDQPGKPIEELPLGSLIRRTEDRGTVRLGRRGRPGWEIRVSGLAARELLAIMPGTRARLHRLASLSWSFWPVVVAISAFAVAQIPSDWAAALTPASLEHRIVPVSIYDGVDHCNSAAGEPAIRHFISRFDPELGRTVKIDVVRSRSFVLTSLPGRRLLVSDAMLAGTTADELAALFAHEIAHLKRNDAVEAVFRARGAVETYGHMIFGPRDVPQGPLLRFAEDQEKRADDAAIAMLVAAEMSPKGGADRFLRLDSADALSKNFGQEQSALHPGTPWRALNWRMAANEHAGHVPAFTSSEVEALANYCPAKPKPQQ